MDIGKYIEKAPFSFDIDRIRSTIATNIEGLEPVVHGPGSWGGWGLWTGTGKWQGGFEQNSGGTFYSGPRKNGVEIQDGIIGQQKTDSHAIPAFKQTIPSEICTGYVQEVLENVRDMNLYPCRVRLARLLPNGGANRWHRDCPSSTYMVRLHIPVFTNEQAIFLVEDEDTKEREGIHLPADGAAYFVRTNVVHRVTNDGPTARMHILMDMTDLQGVSKYCSVDYFKNWCSERGIEPAFNRRPDFTQE